MEVKVKDRQSLPDMAVQTAGSMEAAFRLCEANGVSLTESLADGRTLETVAAEDAETVRRYRVEGILPATELDGEDADLLAQGGIGFMGIEIDFIVS